MAKFEITKRENGEFQFVLKASNGHVILTSEGYSSKGNCKKGIESVKKNCAKEKLFEKLDSSEGGYYFILKSANGKTIGISEIYNSEANRGNGIISVRRNAPDAEIIDHTLTK